MIPEGGGIGGYGTPEEAAILFVFSEYGRQLDGEIAAVIDQGSPLFAAFPPAIVSRVGPEYQQQGNDEAQKAMQDGDVPQVGGLQEVENIGFQPGDQQGIGAKGHYQPKQFSEGIGFMEEENKGDPFFWVIADHAQNLECKGKYCYLSDLLKCPERRFSDFSLSSSNNAVQRRVPPFI